MKKVISLLLASTLCPAIAAAQMLWLGGHTSIHDYSGDPILQVEADTVTAPGFQFGYQPGPRWSLHGWWERGDVSSTRYREPKFELGLVSARLHALRPTLRPWLGLGIGEATLDAERGNAGSDTVFGPELGVDWLFHDNWSLGLGARALYSDSYSEWDGSVFLSLDFRLRLGHNHLPRVQALREARDRQTAPDSLPAPRSCVLAHSRHSPREYTLPIPVDCHKLPDGSR